MNCEGKDFLGMRAAVRRLCVLGVALLAALALVGGAAPAFAGGSTPPPPKNNDLGLQSGWGITVQYSFWLTNRTAVVGVHTDFIDPKAVNGPHEVRITFPANYWTSGGTRYPVLYLMHGGAGGSSRQWTTEGGAAEYITRNAPLITVMPDCGKVGWFYDWPNMSQGMQAWESYHLDQLIPWVDQNLRTIARKEGRAIAGLSMGGFGAVHYAQDRPELFAYAGSFSGAQDLEDQGIRATIVEQSYQNGYWSFPFGPVVWPWDKLWIQNNPLRRADRLRTVWVAIYAGSGIHDQDILERTVGWSSFQLSNAMDAAGIPHFWWMYGRGPGLPWGCDGGHNFNCWNFAFEHSLPGMMAHLWHP